MSNWQQNLTAIVHTCWQTCKMQELWVFEASTKVPETCWSQAKCDRVRCPSWRPEGPLCEIEKVKPKMQWRSQSVGDARVMEHPLHRIKPDQVRMCVIWIVKTEEWMAQALWNPDDSVMSSRCLTWSWNIWCFPYWVLDSYLSLSCLHFTLLE